MRYVLAYDLGTGGTKACLYTEEGRLAAAEFASVKTAFPKEKFHEQRPEDWWHSVAESTRRLLASPDVLRGEVAGIAVSGHSLGAVPVDARGRALAEWSPIWSDARAGEQALRFFREIDEPSWYLATGNGFPAPLYAIFKIMWLRDHHPELYGRAAMFLGTKDYINCRLTGVLATDHSYASGSGAYDLRGRVYRADYIAAAGVAAEKLPGITDSHAILGGLTAEAAAELGLTAGVPVACGGVDNACMALGAGCVADGDAYTSLGTSAWIAATSHEPIVNPLRRTYVFAHCIPGMFTSATSIFSAGNSLRWVKNELCKDLAAEAERTGADVYDLITGLAASSPVGANKLLFNPSLAGGSATEKSPDIRGALLGLTLGHTRADILRAVLEGIALNLRQSLDVLAETTEVAREMLLVGGGGKSAFWRQVFADCYERGIRQSSVEQDAGSLGAMACAAVGLGLWPGFERVREAHKIRSAFQPIEENARVYRRILPLFARAADMQADLGDALTALRLE